MSDFRILRCIGSFGLFDYLYWWANVVCVSEVCQMRIGHWKHYLTLDSWTMWLIWSIWLLYQMGYLFLESFVSQLHFYHFITIFIWFKLLTHLHMVSLTTVLNGNVGQFFIIFIHLILTHLVCFITGLSESFNSCILCLFWFNWSVLLLYQMDISVQSLDYLFVSLFFHLWYA